MEIPFYNADKKVLEAADEAMRMCREYLERTDDITEYNQLKMLRAFQNARVSESCFINRLWLRRQGQRSA